MVHEVFTIRMMEETDGGSEMHILHEENEEKNRKNQHVTRKSGKPPKEVRAIRRTRINGAKHKLQRVTINENHMLKNLLSPTRR